MGGRRMVKSGNERRILARRAYACETRRGRKRSWARQATGLLTTDDPAAGDLPTDYRLAATRLASALAATPRDDVTRRVPIYFMLALLPSRKYRRCIFANALSSGTCW